MSLDFLVGQRIEVKIETVLPRASLYVLHKVRTLGSLKYEAFDRSHSYIKADAK